MRDHLLAGLRFRVEHRRVAGDGGPALRVTAADGRELLRFDCFERGAHWHLAPSGDDVVSPIARAVDPVSWCLGELRRDLPGYLARAGAAPDPAPGGDALAATLDRVESELRNPPPDFDAVDLDVLRAAPGEKWRLHPDDVLCAWVADMDFAVAEPIRLALRRAVDRSYLGYPVNARPEDLPRLFTERMRERFDWEVSPRRVEMLSEVVQGIYVCLLTLCGEGDGVLVQTPVYPPFLSAVARTRRRLLEVPLVAGDARYEIDGDAMRAAAAEARVLLLCHPHNPSGRAFTRAELEGFAQLALEHDLIVISDEIHADLVFAPHAHLPFATLGPEVEARTVTLTSASKAFNVAGLRCAVAAFGSDELRRRFCSLPRHVRGGLNVLGLLATEAAWRHSQPWLEAALAYLAANRDLVARFVAERLPGVRGFPPEATYLAWLDCRALDLGKSPGDFFLERARVALSDGRGFGAPGEGFVRLNFATSRAILLQMLERMEAALRTRG